jgi:HSP20 family protein
MEDPAMNATIDQTIERVEQLFWMITGTRPPRVTTSVAPIPPETDAVAHVEEQLERLVAAIERLAPNQRANVAWTPRSVAWRDDDGIALAVDLPGIAREQININVDKQVITISGQRHMPWSRSRPARSVDNCDVPFGTFSRSFVFASQLKPEHVSARFDQGVLTLFVGSKQSEPSQLPIRS